MIAPLNKQNSVFGTDKIAIKDIEFIETDNGLRLEQNDLLRWFPMEWKPSVVRRAIILRMVRDAISLGADLAEVFTLNSAANAADAASEWYWSDVKVRKYTEDAKKMSRLGSWLSTSSLIWSLFVILPEGKEEKESYEMFVDEQGAGIKRLERIGMDNRVWRFFDI